MHFVLKAAIAVAAFSILPWTNCAIAASKPRPLFASDDVLSLTLKGPFTDMPRDRGAKPVAGLLTVGGGAPELLPVALSVRGSLRRTRQVCPFPPLRVDFTQKPPSTSIFKGQTQLKLVTHCQRAEDFQQYILLEYAAYRLYSALTPESFDVRLAKINYVDDDGHPITTRVGFFIEDARDVARRNGQKRLRGVNHISISQLDPAAAARFALFQYMIANLDWAMTTSAAGVDCCHNSRLVGEKGTTTGLIPVPYDFDQAGLVNTPYAAPPERVSVPNVQVRRYRGFCQHNEQAQAFAAQLAPRRAELLTILDQTPQFEERTRRTAASYMGKFFDQISTPSQVDEIMKTCLR